ncbi:Protein CBG03284 [Caenorhabditis briggsae]|uniref:Protein CBG03284 n=1 Tax=Caenorhabditis briggsae TaxID=6238 RepID=A8WSD8_CAEBR|nr:Protein CBG03284 [Caenorhabditis briggsae]CAP23397.1 Protein CBG03284 [Caenorhabditis briggsae]
MAANCKKRLRSEVVDTMEPPKFVAYDDYLALFNHVVRLTDMVNHLRGGIIESGVPKLSLQIANTC